MPRVLAASALLFWVGGTLLLSQLRWFNRRPLAARLRPYEPGAAALSTPAARVVTARDLLGPAARAAGGRVATLLGVQEPVAARLERVHADIDATAFRTRQMAWCLAGTAGGAVLTTATRPPLGIALLFVGGGGLLAFLVVEQQLASASDRWKRRVFLELPVLTEQLGMLLGAGYSLGSALQRLATRGSGASAVDLAIVCGRMRQGLSEVDALREWADRVDIDALHRLVSVLALNREAADLARLTSEEARTVRREVQRELIEQIERRGQQVWIPVTVATLVPGALLLAVPFIEAMRLFSSS